MNDASQLNPEQKQAIKICEGAVLVLAGAGSGKTRVVTTRIAHLIEQGIPPSKILGVTFTNKAAGEMKERVEKLCNQHVLICTFHSLGARVLRESIFHLGYSCNFTIYDEDDVEKLLKACLNECHIKEKKGDLRAFRRLISNAKNALLSPDDSIDIEDHDLADQFPKVYSLYLKRLQEYQAVDFDDLLYLTVRLWKEYPEVLASYQDRWPFVLIDEYQDTNASQYTMAKLLVAKSQNLFVVGDPDQSIYSWRGANIQNILNFELDYPGAKVIRLEQNYRSTSNILNAANALIDYNTGRLEKKLWSDLGPGEKIRLYIGETEKDEANFVATQIDYHRKTHQCSLNDMVIFYRTNAQSRAFEDSLIYRNIPYVIVGGISFYQRREIKDILAFLRISQSASDYISFARTINLPKRGLGDATIEKIRVNASQENMTVLSYCEALLNKQPLQTILRLSAKQQESLQEYVQIIYKLHDLSQNGSIKDLVLAAIEQTGYMQYLAEDKETFAERKENLDELIAKAAEWEISSLNPSLEAFLEELSLKSSLDESDSPHERLSLMTIHNGKGLEFNTTFLVGLEEDLFPHANSRDSAEALEEERRLCYVGITRAKKYLYVTHCRYRYLWGTLRTQRPSRFLKEIPLEYMEKHQNPRQAVKYTKDDLSLKSPSVKQIQTTIIEHTVIYDVGTKIYHNEFGAGKIVDSYEGSMGTTYKILFENDRNIKTIVAKYAKISSI